MKLRTLFLMGASIACFGITGAAAVDAPAAAPPEKTLPPAEKCDRRLPPIALYGAANDLLEAAYYAQWVLEDIACKYPENEEVKRAIAKLNVAIGKAEGR